VHTMHQVQTLIFHWYSLYLTSKDQLILDQIKREQNFIESTERTIAARARLARAKGEIDKELDLSLQRARSTITLLESKLKGTPKSIVP
jgi:hypothetical protein